MALKQFDFGFVLNVVNHLSPVIKQVEGQIEHLNESVKNTARLREFGANAALIGGGIAAVGGAGLLVLSSFVKASGAMQSEMTHVQTSMNDGAATVAHLTQAKEAAEKASTASGISAIQEAAAYYMARSEMLNHTQALAAMNVASKLAIATTANLADAQAAAEPVATTLVTIYQNFGDKTRDANSQIAGFGNTLAKLQTQYAFRDISQLTYAMQYASPAAKSMGVSFNDASAALVLLSRNGLHGAEAGTAFEELINKFAEGGKIAQFAVKNAAGGLDVGASLAKVAQYTKGLDAYNTGLALHGLGFSQRSIQGVALMLGNIKEYRGIVADLNNSKGALDQAFNTRQAGWDVQVGRLTASWEVFKETIGDALLGPLGNIANALRIVVDQATEIAKAHPEFVKFAVISTAIGAALMTAAGSTLVFLGAVSMVASFVPAAIAMVTGAVGVLTAAFGALSIATIAFNPIAWVAGAAAAAALIYEYWGSIKSFFTNLVPEFFEAGANLIEAIAKGILSKLASAGHAIAHVAEVIASYIPHSPAKEGPLRNLHRVRIVETIAETMRPGPALAAIKNVARAVAVAAPIALAPMALAAPAIAASAASRAIPAAPAARYAAASRQIVINYSPTIHLPPGTSADEFSAELRKHARELVKLIRDETTDRSRTGF